MLTFDITPLYIKDAGKLTADADLCKYLLDCLSTHPDLGAKVAEIFATLAKEGMYRITKQFANNSVTWEMHSIVGQA